MSPVNQLECFAFCHILYFGLIFGMMRSLHNYSGPVQFLVKGSRLEIVLRSMLISLVPALLEMKSAGILHYQIAFFYSFLFMVSGLALFLNIRDKERGVIE
mgnify:CR=1 FL=1